MVRQDCTDCIFKSAAASNLNSSEFEVLKSNTAQVNFKKGEIIFKQDALSLNVAYLRKGIAKIHMRGPSGEKILRIVKAPSYLGLPTTIVSSEKINYFSATALSDAAVCFIDSNLFRNFIYSNGKFAYEIILELCQNELFDYQRCTSQTQKQIPGLVAETLLYFSDKIYGKTQFTLPITRGEIGDLVGTSRESISRVLNDFSNENIISLDNNEVNILKMDLLKQISEKG